jgi:hypothetical protein
MPFASTEPDTTSNRIERGRVSIARCSRGRGRAVSCCAFLLIAVGISNSHAASVVFSEDFEHANTAGWVIDGPDDTASQGTWEFGDPVGTDWEGAPAQPEVAAGGSGCAFTAQNQPGQPGFHDVDNGLVWLVSPPIDLSGQTTATLTYQRWYYLRDLNEDPNDYFIVQVRPDPAAAWVTVESLGNSQPFNTWTPVSFPLHGLIPLTATAQVRFGASDGAFHNNEAASNVIEAAVDDVLIEADTICTDDAECGSSGFCDMAGACQAYGEGDFDADGDVDLRDMAPFLCCFGESAMGDCQAANLGGDAWVDSDDWAALVARLSGPQSAAR